ncbi:MAG TPA: hypothetical protein VI489_01475 [Candidatus Brocadiaceae bacterium]
MKEVQPKTFKDSAVRSAAGAVVLFSSLLPAIGYDNPKIQDGYVVEKIHENARFWMTYTVINAGANTIVIPHPHPDDEDWIIRIKDCKPVESGKKECQTADFYVDQAVFDSIDVGDYADISGAKKVDKIDPIKNPKEPDKLIRPTVSL